MKQDERRAKYGESGFTVVELTVGLTVFAVVAMSFLVLFISLVHSAVIAKQKAVASTLATNQMEYLKSLPYDSLAISGGTIYSTSPLPALVTKKVNGVTYKITSSINYADDAYDGCASYPTLALKEAYCRNYPPPAGSPAVDTNPADYKNVHVAVTGPSNGKLADVDTQISAKVSETASTTGALFVKIVDNSGNSVSGATVTVLNTTITPNVNASDTTDVNGVAIFYGLPPDSNAFDYKITSSKSGYSMLSTIIPSGSLQPTYPNQKILTQQSSYVTLTLKMQGNNSLVMEAVDTAGTPISTARIYVKGGYKRYTATTDTTYYFDTLTPSDTRPTTDASGLAALSGLVPGQYLFCGDLGATSCSVGGATRYLAAAVPYSGLNPFNPVSVPTYDPAAPPATFSYGGTEYLQKVRLILTTSSTYPRITSLSPSEISLASDPLNNIAFNITGVNLPCTASGAGCGTTVRFTKDANTYTATCTGSSAGTQLSCTINLTGITAGIAPMTVIVGANTLTLPGGPLIGGFVVVP